MHVAASEEPHVEQMNEWLKGRWESFKQDPPACTDTTLKHTDVCSNDVSEIAHLQQTQAPTAPGTVLDA